MTSTRRKAYLAHRSLLRSSWSLGEWSIIILDIIGGHSNSAWQLQTTQVAAIFEVSNAPQSRLENGRFDEAT